MVPLQQAAAGSRADGAVCCVKPQDGESKYQPSVREMQGTPSPPPHPRSQHLPIKYSDQRVHSRGHLPPVTSPFVSFLWMPSLFFHPFMWFGDDSATQSGEQQIQPRPTNREDFGNFGGGSRTLCANSRSPRQQVSSSWSASLSLSHCKYCMHIDRRG